MFDGFSVLCYDKLDFNLDKGDMEVQNLVHQKDNFLGLEREEREKFFSAPSGYAEFSNSQLFFYMFSTQGKYKLYHDGEFSRMCADMEKFLGKELYSELMENLKQLRARKVQKIMNNAPEFLMHVSNVSPDKMGDKIIPHSNLNQFGEQRDNFVFATDSETERDFYALRVNDKAGRNINWKKTAKIDGQIKPVFIMDKINHESYTYFVPKSLFLPVVALDGRFGHEWVANKSVPYSSCEKNNVEEMKKRNIIKIVNHDKFCSQNPDFFQRLNNPDLILDTLDNSGVLKYENMPFDISLVKQERSC